MSDESKLDSDHALGAIERLSSELNASSPSNPSLDSILHVAAEVAGASSVRLFRIRLPSRRIYLLSASLPSVNTPPIDFQKIAESDGSPLGADFSILEQVVATRTQCSASGSDIASFAPWASPEAQQLISLPVLRGESCIGVIELEFDHPTTLSTWPSAVLDQISGVLRLLLDRWDAFSIADATTQPIDFTLPFKNFVADLVRRAAHALSMPRVSLCEWDTGDALECLASYGYDDLEQADFDVIHLEEYSTYRDAVQGNKVLISHPPQHKGLRHKPELAQARSYMVAPVRGSQEQVLGTLSCAADGLYDFSALEERGLQTIANWMGGAIVNYRNANLRAEAIADDARLHAALTSLEVAQAARHEARSALMHASMNATRIFNECQKEAREVDRGRILAALESMMTLHQDVDRCLDRVRQITSPPKDHFATHNVKQLWQEAFGLVQGRLERLRIRHFIDGPDVAVQVYPEYLKTAFLNLILNSIDAFQKVQNKLHRSITIRIVPPTPTSTKLRMEYADNATGIDLARLKPKERGKILTPDDILKPGVTGKRDGSGFGLYLVRQIMIQHGGSIELQDFESGVTFEITIETKLRSQAGVQEDRI